MQKWWLVLFLVGCPTDDSTPVEADADTDADTDADADADTDADSDTDPGEFTNVSGVVTDGSGAPLADAQIRFCRLELCLNGNTDSAGSFSFDNVQAFPHSFEVIGPAGAGLATGFTVVTLEADTPKNLDMALLPLGAASPLGGSPTWHEIGDGLQVELATGDLITPPFLPDATEVAGVRVPSTAYPTIDGLENVIALWYVSPFDYEGPAAGIPATIDNDFGLPEGGTYEVYVGDYATSSWLPAGTVTNTGGVLSGASLPLMSAVALTEVQ